MRINKYISSSGLCSRREADRLICEGKVLINGRVAKNGDQVSVNDRVTVNKAPIIPSSEKVYLAYNKPRGLVCTSEKREKNNIMDAIDYPKRITYAGRLDKDSEGLILLTDDGDLIDALMRARNEHEKEYSVTVDKAITAEFIKKMRQGIYLKELERETRPCKVKKTGDKSFDIILTQGLNRQIRRMCETLGYRVKKLKRIRICNILLNDLKTGRYRELYSTELKELMTILDITPQNQR
ncbi:MAG: pseudouridine synthase [Lachnospiraceae bacterium]|nr:pseudouridine synthase [Lachnospiraceae bacterium]